MATNWQRALAELRTERADLARQLADLDTAIAVLTRKFRPAEDDEDAAEATPRRTVSQSGLPTQAHILDVIDVSDREWTAPELLDAIRQRGWQTTAARPIDAIRAALVRLSNSGTIERARSGHYRRSQRPSDTESPEASGLSVQPPPQPTEVGTG